MSSPDSGSDGYDVYGEHPGSGRLQEKTMRLPLSPHPEMQLVRPIRSVVRIRTKNRRRRHHVARVELSGLNQRIPYGFNNGCPHFIEESHCNHPNRVRYSSQAALKDGGAGCLNSPCWHMPYRASTCR
jgi:hypothetical protein